MGKATKALSLALILLLAGFGISQFYAGQAYKQQLEAQYQRAFRELAFHINGIEMELAKADVASSAEQTADSWANILRLVYAAQANLGQLPVSGLQLSRIEHFLAQVQNEIVAFARESLRYPGRADSIGLKQMYQQAQYLNGEMQNELAARERETSWTSWERYFRTSITRSSNIEPGDRNPLMQSLMMIEDGMRRFPDSSFPGEINRLKAPIITGNQISPEDAITVAREFLADLGDNRDFQVVNESQGELRTFTVQASPLVQGSNLTVEISQHEGLVLWMTNPRGVERDGISLEESKRRAQDFLIQRDFPPVEIVSWDQYRNRTTIGFVPVWQDALIYPQPLKVQVAMDTGEILGFQAFAYHGFQRERDLQPLLSRGEAESKVRTTGLISGPRLAVILNASFQEVLAYEFRIQRQDDQFLVYINANTGHEEKINRVQPGEVTSW